MLAFLKTRSATRVAIASFVGTTIEYYDFFIYATAAALVFPLIFFPDQSPLNGTLLAFATFGVGFAARPLGGLIFGHFGDRLGRKPMLVFSLVGMGSATFLIGVLPTHEAIGSAAPIALIILRLFQGFFIGGEWGGATLMAVEHAPRNRRGFFGAFPLMGAPAGTALATLAFLLVGLLPDGSFLNWGWRIPFLASALLVIVGLVVRLTIEESPTFLTMRRSQPTERSPFAAAWATHWRSILLVAGIYLSQGVFAYLCISYFVSYGTTVHQINRVLALAGVLVAALVAIVLYAAFGAVSDRIGRKTTYLIGAAAMTVSVIPVVGLIDSGDSTLFILAVVLLFGLAMSPAGGATGSLFALMFPPSVRYTGVSIGYTISQVFGGAVAPLIAAALYGATGTTLGLCIYMLVVALISVASILILPGQIGRPESMSYGEEGEVTP